MTETDTPETTEVLIVGAGPVGLTLALALRRLGVQVLLVDQHASGLDTSRAAVIHARTLEVLEPAGVVPALLARGIHGRTFTVREAGKVLLQIDFSQLPSAYRFALLCPQNETEAVLLAALQAGGGEVLRPARLASFGTTPQGVRAELALPDGTGRQVRAQWIVGCDGSHSTVRSSAGIGFEGGDYAETFVLADVDMDWPLARDEVDLFLSADGLMVVAPLPDGDGRRYRVVATVAQPPAGAPTLADVQALIDRRGPQAEPGRVRSVAWSSGFHIEHRVASTIFQGRVLLCGDAAHVHSPAGGQGMNTGIQDAMALAVPLARALREGDVQGLETWAEERHRVAREVVRMTDALTRVGTASSPVARGMRNAVMSLVGHVPFLQHKLAAKVAELGN